jgi:hypothetical protein
VTLEEAQSNKKRKNKRKPITEVTQKILMRMTALRCLELKEGSIP